MRGRGRGDVADDDAGGVLARGPVDRHERVVLTVDEVEFHERSGLVSRFSREQRHQVVRVHRAPASAGQDVACVVVERLHRGRRRLGDRQVEPASGLEAEADDCVVGPSGRRVDDAPLHHDLFDTESRGHRHEAFGDRVHLVERDVHGRPHEEHHPVPLEPLPSGIGRLRLTDPVDAARQYALELRQRHQRTVRVAQRGEVPDLGHRDQALVGRLVDRHTVEDVRVLRRREACDLEVLETPEVEPAGDHRVEAAVGHVLDEVVGAPVPSQRVHLLVAVATVCTRSSGDSSDHRDPREHVRQLDRPQRELDDRSNVMHRRLRIDPQVEVGDGDGLRRALEDRSDALHEVVDIGEVAGDTDHSDTALAMVIARRHHGPRGGRPLDGLELADLVEATGQHVGDRGSHVE